MIFTSTIISFQDFIESHEVKQMLQYFKVCSEKMNNKVKFKSPAPTVTKGML
jgi:hypothetical protein